MRASRSQLIARTSAMTRLAFALALVAALPVLGLGALPAGAAEDPVAARQKIMDATGAAAGSSAGAATPLTRVSGGMQPMQPCSGAACPTGAGSCCW